MEAIRARAWALLALKGWVVGDRLRVPDGPRGGDFACAGSPAKDKVAPIREEVLLAVRQAKM